MTRADEPSQLQILEAAQKRTMNSVHTCLPGVVKSFDATSQTAEIQLAIELPSADGTRHAVPPLLDVPILYPRGGGFAVTLPLESGDGVLVMFSEEDYAKWFTTNSQPVQPTIDRRHGIYPMAIPGAFAQDNALTLQQIKSDSVNISHSGGMKLEIKSTGVVLGNDGGGSPEYVALAAQVDTNFATLLNLLQTWTVAPNDGGLALKTAALLLSTPSVTAADVQVT